MSEPRTEAPSLPRAMLISQRIVENAKSVSLVLDGALAAQPGQFGMVWLPGVDEKPFSIAGARPLMFTISRVGPFSEALHALTVGDTVWVRGPFGTGWSEGSGRILLVGGGYGAAPLHFLAQALLSTGARVEVALGARGSAELLFVERFRKLGVAVHVATEDGSAGTRGRVTDVVQPLIATGGWDRLCACGPDAMLAALDGLCRASRLPAELSYEAYMRCGIGICGSCEHQQRLVCRDGPVVSLPAER